MILSPLPPGRARGCAVIEQLRLPSDVMFRKTRLRLYLPGKHKKATLTQRTDAESVSFLSESVAEAVVRRREPRSVREISARPALLASLCLSQGYLAAALFSPLLRTAAPYIAHAISGRTLFEGGGLTYSIVGSLWALPVVVALIRLTVTAVYNGYIHYYYSSGVVSVARGALVRRTLHFPPDAADAEVTAETPFTYLLKKRACFLFVSGGGAVTVPVAALTDSGNDREIMRLERHCSESGTWGGYVILAVAVCVIAIHYAIKYIYYWKLVAAALMPVSALLIYRALAEALLGGRPAVTLYRDTVVINGVWGLLAVSERIGRDNIAHAAVTQNLIQKNRGLCDLVIKAAGQSRAVRCRDVDMPRATVLLERLCR